jgi:valyl-tRNA synthetase
MEKKIKKNLNHEYRILDKIKDLYEELPEYLAKDEVQDYAQRLISFIKEDFGEKYLEIMKIRSGDNSKNVALFCVATILKLLYPLVPFVTEKIRKLYNFKGDICTNTYIPKLEYINKNYKTQIFMDIIDKLHNLRETIQKPKHEKIDICISASIDFQQYMKEHEDIIQKLLYTNEIQYIDNERDLAKYETDTIIDVTIGVRGIGKPIKENNCTQLEQEIIKKQEKLQSIRKITGQLSLQ